MYYIISTLEEIEIFNFATDTKPFTYNLKIDYMLLSPGKK